MAALAIRGKNNGEKTQGNVSRKQFDPVLMFKVLVLQGLYNLTHDQTEFQIWDRFSCLRLLNLTWV